MRVGVASCFQQRPFALNKAEGLEIRKSTTKRSKKLSCVVAHHTSFVPLPRRAMDFFFNPEIANRKQDVIGYWGSSDALHQFCEPHYAFTFYAAEFFNSTSSLAYTAAAIYGALHSPGFDLMVQAEWAALAIIGMGSAAFHGTMLFKYELWDELPMLVLVFVSTLARAWAWRPEHRMPIIRTIFCLVIGCAHLATAASYVIFMEYEIFIHGFTALLLLDLSMSFTWGPCEKETRRSAVVCFWLLLAGKVVWEVENRLCSSVPTVWPLHVAWHLLSCGGACYSIRATALRRSECGLAGRRRHKGE